MSSSPDGPFPCPCVRCWKQGPEPPTQSPSTLQYGHCVQVSSLLSPRMDDRAFSDPLPVFRAPGFQALAGPGPNMVRLNVTFSGGILAARTIYIPANQPLLPLLRSLTSSQYGRPGDYNYFYGMTLSRPAGRVETLRVQKSVCVFLMKIKRNK